jgi:hypothetical protein
LPFNFGDGRRSGIIYPEPHDANGNAARLTRFVRALDEAGAMREMGRLIAGCGGHDTAILSTEYLYHQILRAPQRALLMRVLAAHDINDVTFICIFRSIREHAISAYCHRAGVHPLTDFAAWIADDAGPAPRDGIARYEFWSEARAFVDLLAREELDVRFIDYRRDLDTAFSEVLGGTMTAPAETAVNVSVSLSEAEVLRILYSSSPARSRHLRHLFKALAHARKSPDRALRRAWATLIDREIARNAATLDALEQALGFTIRDTAGRDRSADEDTAAAGDADAFSLSRDQLATLVDGLLDTRAHRPRGPLARLGRRFFPVAGGGRLPD